MKGNIMSKFGWDLPPGVTNRMIEEQAGDPEAEAMADAIYGALAKAEFETNDSRAENACDFLMEIVGSAYKKGYDQGGHDALLPPAIMSISEIEKMLRAQADHRSLENDEAGVLQDLADQLVKQVAEL